MPAISIMSDEHACDKKERSSLYRQSKHVTEVTIPTRQFFRKCNEVTLNLSKRTAGHEDVRVDATTNAGVSYAPQIRCNILSRRVDKFQHFLVEIKRSNLSGRVWIVTAVTRASVQQTCNKLKVTVDAN